jgi:hypothetical protein
MLLLHAPASWMAWSQSLVVISSAGSPRSTHHAPSTCVLEVAKNPRTQSSVRSTKGLNGESKPCQVEEGVGNDPITLVQPKGISQLVVVQCMT